MLLPATAVDASPDTAGSTYLPAIMKYRIPVAIIARPIGVTENMPQISICCSGDRLRFEVRIKSLSRISGDEPTIVIVPPRIAQKPIGMRRRPSGISVRTEIRLTTGRKRAAAPMIMTAMIDMTALLAKPSNRWAVSTRPFSRPMLGASSEVTPSNTMIMTAASSTLTISNTNR